MCEAQGSAQMLPVGLELQAFRAKVWSFTGLAIRVVFRRTVRCHPRAFVMNHERAKWALAQVPFRRGLCTGPIGM